MNNIPDGYPDVGDDPLGLRMEVDAGPGVVSIKFNKPVIELRLNPQQIRALAIALLSNAELAEHTVPDPPSRIT